MEGINHPLFGKKRPDSKKRMLSDANPSKGKLGKDSHSYNTIIVFDPLIKKNIRISKTDTRYLSGELKSIN